MSQDQSFKTETCENVRISYNCRWFGNQKFYNIEKYKGYEL